MIGGGRVVERGDNILSERRFRLGARRTQVVRKLVVRINENERLFIIRSKLRVG